MQRDFAKYAWSLCTLNRRLRNFNTYKTDKNVSKEELQRVVLEDLGQGYRVGYCAMHARIRQYHQFNVPNVSTLRWKMLTQIFWNIELLEEKQKRKRTYYI